MTRVRYYFDDHVSKAIERGLSKLGIDVLRAFTAGMPGAEDTVHLAFATSQMRTIYTNDADFVRLHHSGIHHAGIVYAKVGITIGDAIEGLNLVYSVYSAEEMTDRLEFL